MAAKKRELTAPQQMWVDALTSGKYRWATDSLQSDDGKRQYCCLGVACVVAEQQGVHVKRTDGRIDGTSLEDQHAVRKWLGLRTDTGDFSDYDSLTEYNDESKRNPFKKIAALIVERSDVLFVAQRKRAVKR